MQGGEGGWAVGKIGAACAQFARLVSWALCFSILELLLLWLGILCCGPPAGGRRGDRRALGQRPWLPPRTAPT